MPDNYEPTYEVLRMHNWAENHWLAEDDKCPNQERALLVHGVPLVGDRVVLGRDTGRVVGHVVYPVVEWDDMEVEDKIPASDLRPAPSREDAEVEAVVAIIEGRDLLIGGPERFARAVIAALDEVRGGEG